MTNRIHRNGWQDMKNVYYLTLFSSEYGDACVCFDDYGDAIKQMTNIYENTVGELLNISQLSDHTINHLYNGADYIDSFIVKATNGTLFCGYIFLEPENIKRRARVYIGLVFHGCILSKPIIETSLLARRVKTIKLFREKQSECKQKKIKTEYNWLYGTRGKLVAEKQYKDGDFIYAVLAECFERNDFETVNDLFSFGEWIQGRGEYNYYSTLVDGYKENIDAINSTLSGALVKDDDLDIFSEKRVVALSIKLNSATQNMLSILEEINHYFNK